MAESGEGKAEASGRCIGQSAEPTLAEIAEGVSYVAGYVRKDIPDLDKKLRHYAENLRWRWEHDDPCGDEACPCRKAEADHWRDQGLARP